MCCRRLSIEDVDWGNGEEGVRDWLVQRFKEKDDLLNQLYQGTGKGNLVELDLIQASAVQLTCD